MDIVVLGRGKTGSLVAECAQGRGHRVKVLGSAENNRAAGLTEEFLRNVGMVIDFTTPAAVTENIEACASAGKSVVVGTTGWSRELPRVTQCVQQSQTGLLYAANFSVGVNLFLEVAGTAAEALKHHYSGQIFERHHSGKKDAPSGTALALQ
nr:4-hydroxy-tetrahydrodipicolinate reductase [Terriglobales bacterium]